MSTGPWSRIRLAFEQGETFAVLAIAFYVKCGIPFAALAETKTWFGYITQYGPVRSMLQLFQRLFHWWVGNATRRPNACSPDRPIRRAKKRLGTLARLFLVFLPHHFQPYLDVVGLKPIPEETLKTHARGSKRKLDDLILEEQEYWVETLQKELPDEDDPEDPTYEPTKSEMDSEEFRSQNSTETDLEFEEKNGIVMLKDKPTLQDVLDGQEDKGDWGPPVRDGEGKPPDAQTLVDGSERPTLEGRAGIKEGSVVSVIPDKTPNEGDGAGEKGLHESDLVSSNSQEQWVCVSGE